ncbi:ABC transporter permease [Verrucomicrobium sp. BvORR034]|jgi:oligopeptide transport system permease protein|uniref:ABC transporter permease n=1 Tax=Verrucomicrobium sp. BvORR034 TaxID=1396418 RepID=UPI0006796CF4|nr:ABC transporter permease [Verrucomicrobium sp. BvORR034]
MFAFILRRFLSSLVVLGFVVSLTFLLSVSQKGGPFEREKLSAAAKAERESKYQLDGSKWSQLERYVKRLLRGDLNVSLRYQDLSVTEVLGQKLPNSLILGGSAFVIAAVGGVAMGFVAAMRKDSALDVTSMFFALAAISIPSFITGPLFVALFGLKLGWLPIGGFGTIPQLIMPSICLALPFLAYVARLTRNSLLDVKSQNYMRTAKAKGLDDATALARHAMKVAILPVVTYLGPMAAYVLTGSFVVESVFNISGLGMVFVNAIQNTDPFLLTGAVVVYSALLVFFNFVVDVMYTFLDKRIQLHA